jgi:rhodanese-related sulfurtransferase
MRFWMIVTIIIAFNAIDLAHAELPQGKKQQITAQELKKRLDEGKKTIIVDARAQLDGEILKGAVHVPPARLEEWAKSVNKSAFIVTYCTCPHDEAAESAASKLREMGFRNVFVLSGGLERARAAGIEVVKPTAE